jgi:hypothetical protein
MTPSSADKCQRGQEPVVREDGSVEIPLTQGQRAIVSRESYHLVAGDLWSAMVVPRRTGPNEYRAVSNYGGFRYMHRTVFGATELDVDHRNGNQLDNRLCNLREADGLGNARNQRGRGGVSGLKGVVRSAAKREAWVAQITHNGQNLYLGSFADKLGAARAYDSAARKLHGEFARTNEDAGLVPAESTGAR